MPASKKSSKNSSKQAANKPCPDHSYPSTDSGLTSYVYPRNRMVKAPGEPGPTEQHHKDAVDVNKIVSKFLKTGQITGTARVPRFDDAPPVDFHSAMNIVVKAEQSFGELPSELRARFQNDPGQLLDFVADGSNYAEAVELGLITDPDKAHYEIAPPADAHGVSETGPSVEPQADTTEPNSE